MSLITRFAPSPSGPLHLGHAYAAIVAHEAARATGGKFLVRIEDLDGARSRAEYEAAILQDLTWLGLTWDETPLRQSARAPAHADALARIESAGLVYPCFCTRREILAEIEQIGAAPHGGEPGELPAPYPGTCRALSTAERAKRLSQSASYVLRLDCRAAIAHAASRGGWPAHFVEAWAAGDQPTRIAAHPELFGDIVLARKDSAASYHLAVVVDDAFSGVSAVTRGEDLFAATHIQILLQRLLDLPTPAYGHHALVRDEAGKRLAKRDAARSIAQLRAAGWSSERVRAALPALPEIGKLAAAANLTNR